MIDNLAKISPQLPAIVGLVALIAGAFIVYTIVTRVWAKTVRAYAQRSSLAWDKELIRFNVFGRLARALPGLIVFIGAPFVPELSDRVLALVRNLSLGFIVLTITMALTALIAAANAIYESTPAAKDRPVKGFIQVLELIVWLFGGIMVVAALLDRSPLLLISGLGAMTAILLFVFKDILLSLVSSIQLTSQDMIRVGDWIEMPEFGADGEVVDVQLHTIKVQNWDKTITMLPTDRLIVETFKNWRGMQETGGRRIKRAMLIDVLSIRMQTEEEVERFTRFALLKDYIVRKKQELAEYNAGVNEEADETENVNRRRLTNVGTFRAYAYNYLKNHPKVRDDMMFMVRQLAPTPQGLPLEIYCFTDTTVWAEYEMIQSDIFDHLLAIIPEFGLKLFQSRTGVDHGQGGAKNPASAEARDDSQQHDEKANTDTQK